MSRLFDTVVEHLEQGKLKFGKVDGQPCIHITFGGPGGGLHCRLEVEERMGVVQFWVYPPLFAPAQRLAAVAEFIARANFGLRLGNFALDFETGEIHYKTCAWPGDGPFVADQVAPLIGAAVSTTNRYMPALMKLISSDISAAKAIAEAEGRDPDPEIIEEIGRMLGDEPPAVQSGDTLDEDGDEPESQSDAA